MDDGGASDARPACVALVPVAQPTEWTAKAHQPSSRPASTFVAHLLATAEQALQTRVFVLAKYNVEPVMKKRSEFMKDKAVTPAAGETPGTGAAPPTPGSTPAVSVSPAAMPPKSPGGKIEAVTPAIEVKLPGTEEPKEAPVVAPVEGGPKAAPKKTDKKPKAK